jgi:hypothetical protein
MSLSVPVPAAKAIAAASTAATTTQGAGSVNHQVELFLHLPGAAILGEWNGCVAQVCFFVRVWE